MAHKRQGFTNDVSDLALEIVLDLYNRKREAIEHWRIPARGKTGSLENMNRMALSLRILARVQREWFDYWKGDPAFPQALRIYNILRGR